MFDEATTERKMKQMDIQVRYWDEEKYLETKMFTNLQGNKIYDHLRAILFSISANGPKINKAIWRNLNEELQARNHKGLKGKKN